MSFFRLCLDGNRTKLASMANGNWHVIISKLHNEVLTSFTYKRHDSKLIITHLQIKTLGEKVCYVFLAVSAILS